MSTAGKTRREQARSCISAGICMYLHVPICVAASPDCDLSRQLFVKVLCVHMKQLELAKTGVRIHHNGSTMASKQHGMVPGARAADSRCSCSCLNSLCAHVTEC